MRRGVVMRPANGRQSRTCFTGVRNRLKAFVLLSGVEARDRHGLKLFSGRKHLMLLCREVIHVLTL
jgi:hypothetical protein